MDVSRTVAWARRILPMAHDDSALPAIQARRPPSNGDSPNVDVVRRAREVLARSASVLCDFDDTLVATYRVRAITLARTARLFGVAIADEQIAEVWGRPFPEVIRNLLPGVPFDDFLRRYRDEMHGDPPVPLPGALQLIKDCRENSRIFVIHSSSRSDLIEQDLRTLGWEPFVDAVFGIDRTVFAKPDPRSLQVPIDWLLANSPGGPVVYIGDSPEDSALAAAYGLAFIAVPSPHQTTRSAYAADAPVLASLAELFPP